MVSELDIDRYHWWEEYLCSDYTFNCIGHVLFGLGYTPEEYAFKPFPAKEIEKHFIEVKREEASAVCFVDRYKKIVFHMAILESEEQMSERREDNADVRQRTLDQVCRDYPADILKFIKPKK